VKRDGIARLEKNSRDFFARRHSVVLSGKKEGRHLAPFSLHRYGNAGRTHHHT
jgi:hypothetical protein